MAPSGSSFLIVDDHPVLRQGVASVLKNAYAGATVTEASTVEEAVSTGRRAKPDAVIIDPHLGATDATSSITQLRKSISAPVVVFAADGNMRLLAEALKSGARACVRKDSDASVLSEAIEAARDGRFFIDPALADDADAQADDASRVLTERQRQILQMFADGAHTEKVADALGLSTETIRTHTKRILAKLNAGTRTHAVAVAIRAQVID